MMKGLHNPLEAPLEIAMSVAVSQKQYSHDKTTNLSQFEFTTASKNVNSHPLQPMIIAFVAGLSVQFLTVFSFIFLSSFYQIMQQTQPLLNCHSTHNLFTSSEVNKPCSNSKYSHLRQKISHEKIKVILAKKLLKNSQTNIPSSSGATLNKSTEQKYKNGRNQHHSKGKNRCTSKQGLKPNQRNLPFQAVALPIENKTYYKLIKKDNFHKQCFSKELEGIKIYDQPLFPHSRNKQPYPPHHPPNFKTELESTSQKTFSQTMSTNASHKKTKLRIQDFQLGKLLGNGKFGEVFLAMHKKTGFFCAIKKIQKNSLNQSLKNQLVREIKIQMYLNHPNIVKMYTFFADDEYIYLVLELCFSGQLYSMIESQKQISQAMIKVIIKQISQGLYCMHEHNIIHRDLKPENILFQNGLMKICDFGWSVDTHLMRETFCGTPLYVSPQLLKNKYYNQKVDIWSLGVLTYELLFGRTPFEITSESDFRKIVFDEIQFSGNVKVSDEAKDFICRCLEKDPEKRINSGQVLLHPFLQNLTKKPFQEIF